MSTITESVGDIRARQILTSGVISAAGLHPYVDSSISRFDTIPTGNATILFLVEVVFFGLVFSSAVGWIIQVYEGFRLPRLTEWMRLFHERRVQRWHRELFKLVHEKESLSPKESLRASQLTTSLSDYPFGPTHEEPRWFVDRPTLLGNIIASYELYPQGRYGIDGRAFWYHLIYLSLDAAQEDFLDTVRYAESLVLGSASGALVAIVGLVNLLGLAVGLCAPRIAFIPLLVPPESAWIALFLGTIAFVAFYCFALSAYRETRLSFHALTDLTWPTFSGWLAQAPQGPSRREEERASAVREYLATLAATGGRTENDRSSASSIGNSQP